MVPARLNVLSALISMVGSFTFLVTSSVPRGLIWFTISIVWFVMAARSRGKSLRVESPSRRIARRLSRLLLFS